jgi:hypothetical protein
MSGLPQFSIGKRLDVGVYFLAAAKTGTKVDRYLISKGQRGLGEPH